jgi:hypothetical protein
MIKFDSMRVKIIMVIAFVICVFLYLYIKCGEISLKCFEDKLERKVDCDYLANSHRKKECLLIFEREVPFSRYSFEVEGTHLLTKKKCECTDEDDHWWSRYSGYLEKGDTIIKRKGELVFSIHKKDTILNFNWECEGKTYK